MREEPRRGLGVVRARGKECKEVGQEDTITSYLLMTTVKNLEIFVTSYRWQVNVAEVGGRQQTAIIIKKEFMSSIFF